MRNKIYKSDKSSLLSEGRALIANNDDAVFGRRITLVNMVLSGTDVAVVAANAGMEIRTIQRWVKTVDDAGTFEALRPKHPTGRNSRLSDAQKADLYQVVRHSATDYGYEVWDGKSLSSYIYRTYGVELKERACQDLMHKLGMSLIRPQVHPNHTPDQEPRETFKKSQPTDG